MVDTKPLVPFNARYRAAQRRVVGAYAGSVDRLAAARCFARSVEDFRRLGLHGPGLLVAAEHMAISRLRTHRDVPATFANAN